MSVKISDLPEVTTLKDANALAVVSDNKTSKVTYGTLKSRIKKDLAIETLENTVQELFQSVSNGKTLVASAITDKGVETANDATFQTMADNIHNLSSGISYETISPGHRITEYILLEEVV
jgi:hypothetical protein